MVRKSLSISLAQKSRAHHGDLNRVHAYCYTLIRVCRARVPNVHNACRQVVLLLAFGHSRIVAGLGVATLYCIQYSSLQPLSRLLAFWPRAMGAHARS
jgi:hypothetical protein